MLDKRFLPTKSVSPHPVPANGYPTRSETGVVAFVRPNAPKCTRNLPESSSRAQDQASCVSHGPIFVSPVFRFGIAHVVSTQLLVHASVRHFGKTEILYGAIK